MRRRPAALVLATIYMAGRPFARGALGMAAGLTKLDIRPMGPGYFVTGSHIG